MLQKIQKTIRSYFFKQALQKLNREKMVVGFENAKRLGVLFECNSADEYREILAIVKDLEKGGKSVFALIYINAKALPSYTMAQINFFYCLRNEIAWNLRIRNTHLFNFINSGFDMIIDLSSGNFFPLKYIAGLANAPYKVGIYNEAYVEVFDLLVRESSVQSVTMRAESVLDCIKMINPPADDQQL